MVAGDVRPFVESGGEIGQRIVRGHAATPSLALVRGGREDNRQPRRVDRTDEAILKVERPSQGAADTPRAGQGGTWITPVMIDAYCELHRLGYAHSVESWHDGRLVGGLYGLALGRVFFGESMFAHETDASKVALVHLVALLQRLRVPLIDCQQETRHLAAFGARPISRIRFAAHLAELIHSGDPPTGWRP